MKWNHAQREGGRSRTEIHGVQIIALFSGVTVAQAPRQSNWRVGDSGLERMTQTSIILLPCYGVLYPFRDTDFTRPPTVGPPPPVSCHLQHRYADTERVLVLPRQKEPHSLIQETQPLHVSRSRTLTGVSDCKVAACCVLHLGSPYRAPLFTIYACSQLSNTSTSRWTKACHKTYRLPSAPAPQAALVSAPTRRAYASQNPVCASHTLASGGEV